MSEDSKVVNVDLDTALALIKAHLHDEPDDMDTCGRPMCRHTRHLHRLGVGRCRLSSCDCPEFIESEE